MRVEAQAYERLKDAPHVPRLIEWDAESCCLTLEHMQNGNLLYYLRNENIFLNPVVNYVSHQLRRRWVVEAARALAVVHAADITHCDFVPRKLLLDEQLHLYISGFAGSSVSGSSTLFCAGSRYLPPGWDCRAGSVASDDVFALGSVMYFIMTGTEVYADLEEDKAEELIQRAEFPVVDQIACGSVIQACWDGTISTAQGAVDAFKGLEWEVDDEKVC
ncbi:hypothetical protein CDD80_5827 [Ophiocordyceps camponoti-rufipedis]|uniref:Protein kinase domain-containing protein n=1 Tax=Ophiocordyceps camponoti-rufipedis TaxID=2004952 RepID=A0A2C5ZIQ3_9HYPO|nr:hypothetical protein CDD80_5827 [Ophiocordyceps camponoti-rufipedis]